MTPLLALLGNKLRYNKIIKQTKRSDRRRFSLNGNEVIELHCVILIHTQYWHQFHIHF